MLERPVPQVATYRVQLRNGVSFDTVRGLLEYFVDLGVSHVYLSPCQRAAPNSSHGYDVTEPNRADEAIGGEAGFASLVEALRESGLGLMVDIVPNHMSVVSDENLWWQDMLEHGPHSVHASVFDVDWDGPTEEARSKVLLPILSDHYGRALEAGSLSIARGANGLFLSAMGRKLPLSAGSLAELLLPVASRAASPELELLVQALQAVARETEPERRRQHSEVVKKQLLELCSSHLEVEHALEARLTEVNSDMTALDELISGQFYRLAYHRIAHYDLDYRRFFDINDLAALSIHRPSVFEKTHELVKRWAATGSISALRVDHPDGLRDPAGYFRRLRGAAPGLWIVAEKILQPGETLAEDWQVDGTTGYDFLNVAGGLFVDPNAESLLSGVHAEFVGPAADIDFASSVLESKRLVLDDLLAAELWRLTRIFQKICASKRRHRDFANEELRRALREVIASLPVYRSYFQPGSGYREREASYVRSAVADARLQRPELDSELLTLLQELLCGGCDSELEWEFVGRFQQVSAATMAKGFEDTACYRNARLVSLNEVGGDPSKFGRETSEFHAFCGAISSRWPTTLVATTTHDTKRSEDARLRVSALSEFAPEWAQAVNEWSRAVHAGFHGDPPDRSTEYLIWQTLVASYPISEQRLCVYLQKAIRESKLVTSWSNQNARYEASVLDFARSVLSNPGVLQSVGEFVGQLLPVAWRSSLSQTLLKLTACGVPDIYQGSELWDTRLTDPDNRGPVDFDEHRRLLEVATRASSEDALAGFEQGLPKLWLLQRVLGLRRFKPDWFGPSAGYRPLQPLGPDADRVVAFARGEHLVAVAPRLWRRLLSTGFADTELVLPAGSYRNLFDSDVRYSGKVALGAMLRRFPVALLLAERSA